MPSQISDTGDSPLHHNKMLLCCISTWEYPRLSPEMEKSISPLVSMMYCGICHSTDTELDSTSTNSITCSWSQNLEKTAVNSVEASLLAGQVHPGGCTAQFLRNAQRGWGGPMSGTGGNSPGRQLRYWVVPVACTLPHSWRLQSLAVGHWNHCMRHGCRSYKAKGKTAVTTIQWVMKGSCSPHCKMWMTLVNLHCRFQLMIICGWKVIDVECIRILVMVHLHGYGGVIRQDIWCINYTGKANSASVTVHVGRGLLFIYFLTTSEQNQPDHSTAFLCFISCVVKLQLMGVC